MVIELKAYVFDATTLPIELISQSLISIILLSFHFLRNSTEIHVILSFVFYSKKIVYCRIISLFLVHEQYSNLFDSSYCFYLYDIFVFVFCQVLPPDLFSWERSNIECLPLASKSLFEYVETVFCFADSFLTPFSLLG